MTTTNNTKALIESVKETLTQDGDLRRRDLRLDAEVPRACCS
ncbi:hypothetical protein SAMN02745225_02059 [Ferrithrix thermotolerans DSM 19514]|uniref:Uncharacterized protein n=1 Tax=Ferrithrix thermotolerans DSM 19514 TaxID=1121881 RepID=A0A1M4XL56_9ACTN|nr:hypothetical protein [Ferrithrix thermotolerans]SHE94235.1 hypothetical protein SAMN02745225_02059 [Ferrithrix thermotolerans DSM 19514]